MLQGGTAPFGFVGLAAFYMECLMTGREEDEDDLVVFLLYPWLVLDILLSPLLIAAEFKLLKRHNRLPADKTNSKRRKAVA